MTLQEITNTQYAVKAAIEFSEAVAASGGSPVIAFGCGMSLVELFDLMGRNNIHFVYREPA